MNSQISVGKYLGVNVDVLGPKVQHFTPLLDALSAKIAQWRKTGLNKAAKLMIINSFPVSSIIQHLIVFKLPSTIANKSDNMLARFFRTSSQDTGIHWRKKAILHLPKGLGIRTIGALNDALLMKQAWRIQHQAQLLISRIYSRFWFCHPHHRPRLGNVSLGPRGLFNASQQMLQHSVWKVGNGCSIHAATDKWVNGGTPVINDNVSPREAASLIVADLVNSETKT